MSFFAFVFASFLFLLIGTFNFAAAAEVGDVVSVTGTLEVHENADYTHKVDGFNLIIADSFADLVGEEVTLRVEYTTTTRFRVLSLVATAPDAVGDAPVEELVVEEQTVTGTLSVSPRTNRTYRITAANGTHVDLLTSVNYDSMLGSEVVMTYTGTVFSFRIVSVKLA
ncbi:MAG TPA: hypothetical protein ENI23_11605 [bacterium]|nr:hypothetical protein [bacterium]